MHPSLLIRSYVLPVSQDSKPPQTIPQIDCATSPFDTSTSPFQYFLKLFLASGLQISRLDENGDARYVQSFPFSFLDDTSLAGLYFYSKYAILDRFGSWTDYGEYIGRPLEIATDLPFGTTHVRPSRTGRLAIIYRHLAIGVEVERNPHWVEFVEDLSMRLEHSFVSLLACALRELEK